MRLFVDTAKPSPFCACTTHVLPNPYVSATLERSLESVWARIHDEPEDGAQRNSLDELINAEGGDEVTDEEALRCATQVRSVQDLKRWERDNVYVRGRRLGPLGRQRFVFGTLDVDEAFTNVTPTPETWRRRRSSTTSTQSTCTDACSTVMSPCTFVSTLPTSSDAECTSEGSVRTAEQAAHGVYRATVEPLLAACVDNSIYFEPLELRKLLANAMGVAMQSVPEKDLHRMLRTVVMESNRETWKERTMFWRLTERVQPHFARSLVNAQMAVPSPAPREVAYIFPTFVHAAPVRLPVPAPPAKVTNSEANTPYGAPAIALTAFTGALFAADVLLARDFIEVLALMSGALASGLTKPRIILRAMYALISSAGDRACRSLNSAEAMRKLKVDLAGPPKGCREDGWNTENRRLADKTCGLIDRYLEVHEQKRVQARKPATKSRKFTKLEVVWGVEAQARSSADREIYNVCTDLYEHCR